MDVPLTHLDAMILDGCRYARGAVTIYKTGGVSQATREHERAEMELMRIDGGVRHAYVTAHVINRAHSGLWGISPGDFDAVY